MTENEINAVATFIMAHAFFAPLFTPSDMTKRAVFAEMLLKEPVKAFVKSYTSGPLQRKARALVYLNQSNTTYEVIVPLPDPPNVGSAPTSLTYRVITDVMYPNNNKDLAPIDDYWGGAQCSPPYFTRAELTAAVLAHPKLMARLAARNVTPAMLTDIVNPGDDPAEWHTRIYPYAFYTFESFRNFVGVHGCNCPDLVPLDAPNHRYMPAVFFDQTIIPGGICIETANWGIVEGIFIIVDCTDKLNPIFRIIEDGPLPLPGDPPIVPAVPDPYLPAKHKPMKPICTSMPLGVSFEVDDVNDTHYVKWDNWEFHWSYQRGGMSLYEVKYTECHQGQQTGQKRRVLYKTAPTDTVVVYNAPEPIISRTYVSADSHNWPVLHRLQTLVPGRDCPTYAKLYTIVRVDCKGKAIPVPDAVAIYEQENDLLWRVNQGVIDVNHWPNGFDANGDPIGNPLTGCRKRQLVIRTLFSGFYYLFVYSYMFNQDGSWECYADLMGQTTNQWVEADSTGTEVPYGQRIALQLIALNHTHSVMFRNDFDIDDENPAGGGNSVSEQNAFRNENRGTAACSKCSICTKSASGIVTVSPSGGKQCGESNLHCSTGMVNKCGQVIDVCERTLLCEKEAARQHNFATNRTWSVHNPNSKNRLGYERGFEVYAVSPNGNSVSLARDDSPAHTHLAYLKNHLHVTKYHPGEEYACGEFPVLSDARCSPPGMSTYLANNESIVNTDIVVWLNAMFFHKAHTEDYPMISVHRLGFQFVPENFLDQNPACSLEQKLEQPLCGSGEIGECGEPEEFLYPTTC